MAQITRRTFVTGTIAAGAFATLAPTARVLGANDDIRVAVVGINGRGGSHISAFKDMPGVRVVALCDVDRDVLDKRAKSFKDANRDIELYQDVRKLLENKNIDVVTVATTNHWHSLITIWACQAGKDVYVEKPCSHNVFEGRKCVEAAEKYKRIVQHGTQSRASGGTAKMIAAVKSGKYGKLRVAKGYCCKSRWSIGFKPQENPPANLDFDIWLGPAPKQPFHKNLVHYNWHWFWDFGNGDIGNQGVHEMDKARWAISSGILPKSVIAMGGRFVDEPDFRDQGQTPNMELSVFDYGDCLLVFETRGLVGKKDKAPQFSNKVDNEYYMEGGIIRGGKFFPTGKAEGEEIKDIEYKMHSGDIFKNFINCVRNRRAEELHASIQEAHPSSALCHLGNIPFRLGTEVPMNEPIQLGNDPTIGDSVKTLLENTKAIGVDPMKAKWIVGPKLNFDPETETFIGNDKANALLTRPYRAPFVVPDNV